MGILLPITIVSLVVTTSGCKDSSSNNQPSTQASNVGNVVDQNADLSVMDAALKSAGVYNTLNSSGQYTLFAPTDSAFKAMGITASNVSTIPNLANIIKYHVLGMNVPASQIAAGPDAMMTTLGGDSIFVTRGTTGTFINGVRVTQPDIAAANGVIHKINHVLMPATGNLSTTLQADTTYSLLSAAITRASTGNSNISALLNGKSPYSIFAPTNAAFRSAGYANAAAINAADPNTLGKILNYHLLNGRMFTSDFTNGQKPTTLGGGTFSVGLNNNNFQVTGNGNGGTASNVTTSNGMATNGVMYGIDRVMTP